MNYEEKAKELFDVIAGGKQPLGGTQRDCKEGESGVLLCLLFEGGKIYPSDLSDKLSISLPRVMAIIKSLELKKLVKMIKDKDDKRKRIVFLTEEGKELIIKKREEVLEQTTYILKQLEDSEIDNLIFILKKIKNIMQENNK